MLPPLPRGTWLGVDRAQLTGGRPTGQADYAGLRQRGQEFNHKAQSMYQMVAGTPDTVTAKLKVLMEVLRPGIMVCFTVQGPSSEEDRRRSVELLGTEVLPALREHATVLGIKDPYERRPGSVKLHLGQAREPVTDADRLASLNLG
jgi:hypothetical protein